jgi:hypothetical protein
MKRFKMKYFALLSILLVVVSCHDLDELNINPNGAAPEVADLNLLLPTVITDLGQTVVSLGFGDIAGVMQHTQKTGWSGGHNDYDWTNLNKSWAGYYGILRNAEEFYKKAVKNEYEFHQGAGLVLKAYTIGLITDLWGDAPYTESGKAEEDPKYFKPVFDPQRDIYLGILADLETANTLLSKSNNEYVNINATQDLLYHGDVSKWRKFANSLALRYYMRLQAKEPGVAQEGIEKITSDPSTYPLITLASEDATVGYAGNAPANSWPTNTVYSTDPVGEFMRTKLCATLVDVLQDLNDPRLNVWAQDIKTPIVLVGGTGVDRKVNGNREVSQDIIDEYTEAWGVGVDYDEQFVGIPPSVWAAPQYNMNPNLEQGAYNPHVSQLDTLYSRASDPLLQMRLLSAAEVHLILAEAALYSWAPGNPADHYAAGIRESFNAWGVGAAFGEDYLDDAPYTGLESIIQQKWIASWTAAAEAWFDYRRTGFPNLQTGESAKRTKLPLRFYYHFDDEISRNTLNAETAIQRLEATPFKGSDVSNNSAWSKIWLLQGTGKPY